MRKSQLLSPQWEDYLPSFEQHVLQERLDLLEYHMATFLTSYNILSSIDLKDGKRKFGEFYSHDFDDQRQALAEIAEHTLKCSKIITNAIGSVPIERFVAEERKALSCWNAASWVSGLNGTTPPWLAAFASDRTRIEPDMDVFVIGFGYGYLEAVFSQVMNNKGRVYCIDIVEDFIHKGKKILESLGYSKFYFKVGDGINGWSEDARFDVIWTTCGSKHIPKTWMQQLKEGGRLAVFRPYTLEEVEFAQRNLEGWNKTYEDYLREWWTNTCLSIYKKESGGLIEIERLYEIDNPPFYNDEVGILTEKDWGLEFDQGIETKLLRILHGKDR
jgi:protein-L-isoaspartate(D-aspartate) O-methyltransferase